MFQIETYTFWMLFDKSDSWMQKSPMAEILWTEMVRYAISHSKMVNAFSSILLPKFVFLFQFKFATCKVFHKVPWYSNTLLFLRKNLQNCICSLAKIINKFSLSFFLYALWNSARKLYRDIELKYGKKFVQEHHLLCVYFFIITKFLFITRTFYFVRNWCCCKYSFLMLMN